MKKHSKIYLAGHTGLLGSAIERLLKREKFENVVTRPRGVLDLTDKNNVFDFFADIRPEYVFLAAGKVGGIMDNREHPADYLRTNLAIQSNMFEAATKFDVKNVVVYGSSCTYPKQSPQPIKEEYLLTGPLEETSIGYATAKIAAILAAHAYNRQYRCNRFIALVPSSMYGPGDNFDLQNCHVLSALIRRFHEGKINNQRAVRLWGTGKPKREFVFSDDVAEASLFAMKNAHRLQNTHYNIGTGKDYSINKLASITAEIVDYKGKINWDETKPDGTPRKLLDSSKFLELGWKPKTELLEGIRRTYGWYKSKTVARIE